MRTTTLLTTFLLLAAAPAFGWDNTNTGNHDLIVDGGPGAQSNARATSHASSRSSATGGSAVATGGVSTSSVTLSGLGNGGGGTRAPDIGLPSIGGGGTDCPTVGFGAGGAGLGGGGGFGPSWISSDCNNRKLVPIIRSLYGDEVARAFLEAKVPGVLDAVKAARPRVATTVYPFDFCATRNAGDRDQHLECDRVGR